MMSERTYNCTNMTFEKAYEILSSGKNLNVVFMYVSDSGPVNVPGIVKLVSSTEIKIHPINSSEAFSWTTSGITKSLNV